MAWRSTSTSSTSGTPLLEVGRIAKAHGIRGEVFVTLTTDRLERVQSGAVLQTTSRGALTVSASRPHQHGHIVQFDGVLTRNQAEDLRGTILLAEAHDDADAVWVHELIGASVVDVHGTSLGTVESVEDNPAADLLVLDGGALIPMTFVVLTDAGTVTVDIPDGLLDL
jgi:16S rRNA processing protein RimM